MQYVIFGIILIAFAVLVIKSYAKKLAAGCCGAGGDTAKKVKVADKNKAHYPYAATLTVDGMMCAACETPSTACGQRQAPARAGWMFS